MWGGGGQLLGAGHGMAGRVGMEVIGTDGARGSSSATAPTTRRALLGAGIGALLATVATALGRPPTARADAIPVTVDNENPATATTFVSNKVNDNDVLGGVSTNAGTGVIGISARSNGVKGTSDTGIGVQGRSNTDKGV